MYRFTGTKFTFMRRHGGADSVSHVSAVGKASGGLSRLSQVTCWGVHIELASPLQVALRGASKGWLLLSLHLPGGHAGRLRSWTGTSSCLAPHPFLLANDLARELGWRPHCRSLLICVIHRTCYSLVLSIHCIISVWPLDHSSALTLASVQPLCSILPCGQIYLPRLLRWKSPLIIYIIDIFQVFKLLQGFVGDVVVLVEL